MELLLNLTWLVISLALGVLFLASRRKCKATFGKCVYGRLVFGVTYLILVALLLPAISMTDDRVAMVTPTDGEQIVRRYEVSAGGPRHTGLHVTLFPAVYHPSQAPLAFLWEQKVVAAPVILSFPFRQLPQDRAPPQIASISCL